MGLKNRDFRYHYFASNQKDIIYGIRLKIGDIIEENDQYFSKLTNKWRRVPSKLIGHKIERNSVYIVREPQTEMFK